MVASCASSQAFVDVPDPKVPSSLKTLCSPPSNVPQRVLKKSEVITLWNTDRFELRSCAKSKSTLVDAINKIEGTDIQ